VRAFFQNIMKIRPHFTDHFSGPGRAIGTVCVYVCHSVRTITLNEMTPTHYVTDDTPSNSHAAKPH